MARILLDAGHFAQQNKYHTLSPIEYYESEMTWKLHLYQKAELEKLGHVVDVTRERQDVDLKVQERGKLAKGYDVLISNHSNTSESPETSRAVVVPLWDSVSMGLAETLGECICDVMGLPNYQVYQPESKSDRDGNPDTRDSYYGLLFGAQTVGASAVILEHGFHTHEKTAQWLYSEDNLKSLARAEALAIDSFFKSLQSEELKEGDKVTIREGAYYKGDKKSVPKTLTDGDVFTVSRLMTSNTSKFALLEEITSWVEVVYLKKINATDSKKRLFADVDETSPYYDLIKRSVDRGIISSDENVKFYPEKAFTKVEILKILESGVF